MHPPSSQGFFEVVLFELSGQRYGLGAADVVEITRAVEILPLPTAPPVVEGVVNVRGTVLPVLDMRKRFHHLQRPLSMSDHFIVTKAGEGTVVLHVDQVLAIVQVRSDEVDAAKEVVAYTNYFAGVAKLPDGLVLIHDPKTFLSQGERSELTRALGQWRS